MHTSTAPAVPETSVTTSSIASAPGQADTAPYLEADLAFHSLVLTASGNPLLGALEQPVREVLAGRTHFGMHPKTPAPGTLGRAYVAAFPN